MKLTWKNNQFRFAHFIFISYLSFIFNSHFFRLWEGQNAKNICIILSKIRFALFSRKYKFFRVRSSTHDSYRIFFQKNIVPLLLKNSFLFWKRRMYLFTKMNYLTSYKIQLSDFDSFNFNYFLEESDE